MMPFFAHITLSEISLAAGIFMLGAATGGALVWRLISSHLRQLP